MRAPFLDEQRLIKGPWQAFERDVARLMIMNAFEDVRLIGGSGDHGADVLGVKNGKIWVIQCKYTAGGYPSATAVDEVADAARFYRADRIFVATSRPVGPATHTAISRWKALGVNIELLQPSNLLQMARVTPEYSQSRRTLRSYQEQAVAEFASALRERGRGQVVLATGLGKTVVMAETVARLFKEGRIAGGKVLVLAGTRELVDQLQRAFWDQLSKWIPTHTLMGGEEPAYWEGATFATVQSVAMKLDQLPEFDLVLIDEAHHVGSESLLQIIDRTKDSMIGGVTATPWRGDSFNLDSVLGPPVARIGIEEGLRKGFLCEVDYRLLADDIDWSLVRNHSKNNYSITQLNRLLLLPTRDEEAAKTIREMFDSEKRNSAIVFCSTIVHAQSFAAMLRLFNFRAESITGDMNARERDKVMTSFRTGKLDIVTTRDLFNEGVDVPDVDMIVFMRVTHSRRIFVQQLGRGLRISSNKSKVVVLDFVSDLRRISEIIELEKAVRGDIERLKLPGVVQFREAGAGNFMLDWLKDQADLFDREGDARLELPSFDFPAPHPRGNIQ